MVSVSQAIVGDIIPPRERGRYQGYFSSMYAVASVAGPVLGGVMTEYGSWRWVFLINLPLGIVALVVAHRTLKGLPVPQRKPVIDYLGTMLMILGLGALLLGITEIGQGHGLADRHVQGLLGVAVLALVGFIAYERRAAEPVLPMHLFASRSAVLCWLTVFFASFQSISLTVLMPLRYQTLTGAGADSAALHLLPLAMGMPLGAYCAGRRASLTGRYKPLILGGTLLLPLAITGLAFTTPQQVWLTGAFMVLTGIGTGMLFPTALVGGQNAVQARDMGVATSTSNLFRSLGGAMGVALMSALLLAMLQGTGLGVLGAGALGGEGHSGNALLASLEATRGPALEALRTELAQTFRHLLLVSAGIALLGLGVAVAMPNTVLRGR